MEFRRGNRKVRNQTSRIWCLNTLSSLVGTIIGIILTFGVSALVEYKNRQKDELALKMVWLRNYEIHISQIKYLIDLEIGYKEMLDEMLTLTPADIREMPVDSLDIYQMIMLPDLHLNDLSPSLLDSDMEILRSSDNYNFFLNINNQFLTLQLTYENVVLEGPNRLFAALNDNLYNMAIDQDVKNYDLRWKLEHIIGTPRLNSMVRIYCQNFNYDSLVTDKEALESLEETLFKLAGVTKEDMYIFLGFNDNKKD